MTDRLVSLRESPVCISKGIKLTENMKRKPMFNTILTKRRFDLLAVALSSVAECCGDADADFVAEQEVDGGEYESDYGERNECGCVVGLC